MQVTISTGTRLVDTGNAGILHCTIQRRNCREMSFPMTQSIAIGDKNAR